MPGPGQGQAGVAAALASMQKQLDRLARRPAAVGGDTDHDGAGLNSTQVGTGAVASATDSTAIGDLASVTATGGTAVGKSATASATDGTALGCLASVTLLRGTAVGRGASAGNTACAMGYGSLASQPQSMALGSSALANATAATALGTFAKASGTNAIAIGGATTATDQPIASGVRSIAIGKAALGTSTNAIAIGTSASASLGIAIGELAASVSNGAIAIGKSASCLAQGGLALGMKSSVGTSHTSSWVLGTRDDLATTATTAAFQGLLVAKEVEIVSSNSASPSTSLILSDGAARWRLSIDSSGAVVVAAA